VTVSSELYNLVTMYLRAKYTTSLHSFNGVFSGKTGVSRYQKGKTSLDLNEATDDGVLRCGGISWTVCKQSASRCRQITTPACTSSHIFYRPDALPDAQSTVSTHWRQCVICSSLRCDTRCYFNVRSKVNMSPLNVPHGTTTKKCETKKVKTDMLRSNSKSILY